MPVAVSLTPAVGVPAMIVVAASVAVMVMTVTGRLLTVRLERSKPKVPVRETEPMAVVRPRVSWPPTAKN